MMLSMIAVLHTLHTFQKIYELPPSPFQTSPVSTNNAHLIRSLQSRVGHLMWSEQAAGPSSMLRWLKFKGMNVNNAERAIKETLRWRKDMNLNSLRDEDPDPKMLKRFLYNITTFARNGDPVMIMPFGDWDIRTYIDSGGSRWGFDKHQGQMWEKALAAVERVEAKLGHLHETRKDSVSFLIVCDLQKLEYRQMSSLTSIQYIISIAYNFENNYPEVVSRAFMINCDWIFEALMRIIRPFLQGSVEKLKIYSKDRSEWEGDVRSWIDPINLPHRYGGYSIKERKKLKLSPRISQPLET